MAKEKTSRPAAKGRSARTAPQGLGKTGGNMRADLSPEEVYRLIQETAYFKAKQRGFAPGGEVQDWIEAEAEVRRRLESRSA
jgi:hypothetical protein